LAAIPALAWAALTRGDSVVLTKSSLLVADNGPFGLTRLRVYPAAAWNAFSRQAGIALAPRRQATTCERPASSALCWQPLSAAERYGVLARGLNIGGAVLTTLASIALGVTYLRERRRAERNRLHVLRTLTHELRTPATSLRLDIEPLRAAYD